MWGYMHDGGGWFGFGGFFMILFWIVLIGLVVAAMRWLIAPTTTGQQSGGKSKSALDILEERFAKGEIDAEEFDERKKKLME